MCGHSVHRYKCAVRSLDVTTETLERLLSFSEGVEHVCIQIHVICFPYSFTIRNGEMDRR